MKAKCQVPQHQKSGPTKIEVVCVCESEGCQRAAPVCVCVSDGGREKEREWRS